MAQAQDYHLPAPGVMVHLSPAFNPPILKGIKVYPDNPFKFDFILDKGDSQLRNDQLKDESAKLIKYFLASLTIPEKDLWVNLSPYEKDRIIPQSFGLTEMGRDLLAEDYMLKQITASLIYPDDSIGKKFWKRIYEEAKKKFGTTNIPVNAFNKVWIVPEKAIVYEDSTEGTAYVVESKLKVMLEQDYLSLEKHKGIQSHKAHFKDTNQIGSQILREVVIPELSKEVNENKNFSHLRQIYNSLILATWYKNKIKDSILGQVYVNKNKVAGVNIGDSEEKDRIYQRYLWAFKKGVFNYIKEDIGKKQIPRKYFSGGFSAEQFSINGAMTVVNQKTLSTAMVSLLKSSKQRLAVLFVFLTIVPERIRGVPGTPSESIPVKVLDSQRRLSDIVTHANQRRNLHQPIEDAAMYTKEDERKIKIILKQAQEKFPENNYGWAKDLIDPGSRLVEVKRLFPAALYLYKKDWIGYDCQLSAGWIVKQLRDIGYKANILVGSTPTYGVDYAAGISGSFNMDWQDREKANELD